MIYWSNKEPQIICRLLLFPPCPKDQYSYCTNIFYLALCNVTEKKNKYTAPWRATQSAAPLSAPASWQTAAPDTAAQAALPHSRGRNRSLHTRPWETICCSWLPIQSAPCLQHPRENRSDLPSPQRLSVLFRLPAARGIQSCLATQPCLLPCAGMGLSQLRVCSPREGKRRLCWRGSQASDWKTSLILGMENFCP